VIRTEDFLNTLGVNTHLGGLTKSDPWNTNIPEVASQLNYIGVRLVRDWPYRAEYGVTLKSLQEAWRKDGRFWLAVVEGSPADQRTSAASIVEIAKKYPDLVYAASGPNEEDNGYAQKLGATLPDSALVQADSYNALHPMGIMVSQMEFGSGWVASNNWQGNYNPTNTGSKQNYTPGPADFGGAHTYVSNGMQTLGKVIGQMRANALLCTPGKPVAHTELGAYTHAHISPTLYGQFLVMGAFTSAVAGDVGYLVYGLQDSAPEATYGFYSFPQGVAHPAAKYFHTMTTLLASTKGSYGPGAKPTYTATPLAITFANPTNGHAVLQKPTGEYVVAAWSEQLMNEKAHDETDAITLPRKFATATVYNVRQGVTPTATLTNVSEVRLDMEPSDTYLIVLK
jgi:hypothetical protein